MSIDGTSIHREGPVVERMAELMRQLCAKELLSAEETEAVVRKATRVLGVTSVEWPADLAPRLRSFASKR